jgi:hypothetical protein
MMGDNSTDLFTFWGKTDRSTAGTRYHPAICHMIDVGIVAKTLASVLRFRFGGFDLDTVAFLCAMHDIGKLSPVYSWGQVLQYDRAALGSGCDNLKLTHPTGKGHPEGPQETKFLNTFLVRRNRRRFLSRRASCNCSGGPRGTSPRNQEPRFPQYPSRHFTWSCAGGFILDKGLSG